MFICFFKQKTSYGVRISDWSSDVCSSDLVVHAEGLVAAVRWDAVEARFGHRQQGAVAARLEAELDQGRRLVGVVDARLDRVRMPGEREQSLDRKSVV